MGGGSYSVSNATASVEASYTTMDVKTGRRMFRSKEEIFTQKSINNAMNPYGIVVRESRDSKEHPNSLAIVIALDVTGSMGSVPHHLITTGLPTHALVLEK